ncbi:MAG: hypothetical protein ABIO06_09695 [Pseudolysinimonas sp.]
MLRDPTSPADGCLELGQDPVHATLRRSFVGGVVAIPGIPQRCLRLEVFEVHAQDLDLELNAFGMPQHDVALLTRRRPPDRAVGLIPARLVDADSHRPQAGSACRASTSLSR